MGCLSALSTPAQAQEYYGGDELSQLERERSELSLAGPIIWTIVGGTTALTGGSFLIMGLVIDSQGPDCTPSDGGWYGEEGSCLEIDATPFLVIGVTGLVIGTIVLAVAMPELFSRIDERRELGLRIRELRRRREGSYGFGQGEGPKLSRALPVLTYRF